MCHVSQCWPFPSPLNHTGLFPHPSSHPHCSAAFKGRAWHWNQHVSFSLLWWEQQKQPWSLPACACHTVPPHHQSHPARRWRARVTLQTSPVLWALMGRLAEPEKSCDHRAEPSLSYLPRQLFKKPSSYEFSANIYPFCIVGKSGASMCWSPLQLQSHLLGDMQATWCLQVRFSVFNPERSALPPGPQHRLWRGSTRGWIFQHKVRKMQGIPNIA